MNTLTTIDLGLHTNYDEIDKLLGWESDTKIKLEVGFEYRKSDGKKVLSLSDEEQDKLENSDIGWKEETFVVDIGK